LVWSGVPDSNVVSFALVVHYLDAAGNNGDDLLHWMVWNIPPSVRSLPEGVPQGPQLADGARQISASGPYYRGPAAPGTGPVHHYVFTLYALDAAIDVPPVGAAPAATRTAVMAAMAGHVRGKAVLVGTFKRKSSQTTIVQPPRDAIAVRVLGSLIEKEITTPDNYPLSLNALVGACNQTSAREAVD